MSTTPAAIVAELIWWYLFKVDNTLDETFKVMEDVADISAVIAPSASGSVMSDWMDDDYPDTVETDSAMDVDTASVSSGAPDMVETYKATAEEPVVPADEDTRTVVPRDDLYPDLPNGLKDVRIPYHRARYIKFLKAMRTPYRYYPHQVGEVKRWIHKGRFCYWIARAVSKEANSHSRDVTCMPLAYWLYCIWVLPSLTIEQTNILLRCSFAEAIKTIAADADADATDDETNFNKTVSYNCCEWNPLIWCPEEDGVVQLLQKHGLMQYYLYDPLLLLRQIHEMVPTTYDQWIARNTRSATEWLRIHYVYGSFAVSFVQLKKGSMFEYVESWYENEWQRVQFLFHNAPEIEDNVCGHPDWSLLSPKKKWTNATVEKLRFLPCWHQIEGLERKFGTMPEIPVIDKTKTYPDSPLGQQERDPKYENLAMTTPHLLEKIAVIENEYKVGAKLGWQKPNQNSFEIYWLRYLLFQRYDHVYLQPLPLTDSDPNTYRTIYTPLEYLSPSSHCWVNPFPKTEPNNGVKARIAMYVEMQDARWPYVKKWYVDTE